MKACIVLVVAMVALAAARPQQFTNQQFARQAFASAPQQQVQQVQQVARIIPVLSRTDIRDDRGQLSSFYQSADGTALTEHGTLKQIQEGEFKGDYFLAKKGSWRYPNPENPAEIIEVTYIADENGFQPMSRSIPVQVQPISQ